MPEQPRYIAAYRLRPDQFIFDVARVLQKLIRINGNPVDVRVLSEPGDSGIDMSIWFQGKHVGIVWADRYEPTVSISPDHIRDICPARTRSGAKYAYLVTSGRATAGAKSMAKEAHIIIVEGEQYEEMRARAYGWDKPVPTPIYFDNSPRPVEKPREATPDEVEQAYIRLHRPAPSLCETNYNIPVVTIKHKVERPPVPDEIGMLTQKERAVILAWRRGNKAEAAKIILND